jgi:hypothetical protein
MQLYNFSDSYVNSVEQGALFHKTHKTWAGKGTFQYIDHLSFLKKKYNASSMLDFGCGKGIQFENNKIQNLVGCDISGYDPCIHGLENWPAGNWDIVYSLDAISSLNDIDTRWVFDEFLKWKPKAIFISTQSLNIGKSAKVKIKDSFDVPERDAEYWKTLLKEFNGTDVWIMDNFQFIVSPED